MGTLLAQINVKKNIANQVILESILPGKRFSMDGVYTCSRQCCMLGWCGALMMCTLYFSTTPMMNLSLYIFEEYILSTMYWTDKL